MRKLVLFLCVVTSVANAQIEDLNTAAGDLIFLTEKYISPAASASVYQASSGWYTSVVPKKKFEVEVSIQYNTLFIPSNKTSFLVEESQLQNLSIQGSSTSANLPTALGDDNFVVLEGDINGNTFEFDSPEGINDNTVKHGQLQATIGLWKKTNLMFRYAPNIGINNTNFRALGFGLSHNLNQWIKPLKESGFNLAILGTFSDYYVDDTFNTTDVVIGSINAVKVEGQSYGINLIASKRWKRFDFSTGLCFMSSTFDYTVGGEGDLLLDILNTALDNLSKNKTNFKAGFGANYNFKDFSINTMFSIGTYPNVIVGLNYSFLKNISNKKPSEPKAL